MIKSHDFGGPPVCAVNAVIFRSDNRVLVTKRRDGDIWCLPGGLVDFGESVVDAVVREVREEVGLHVTVSRLVGVYSEANLRVVWPARQNSIILTFQCEVTSGELSPGEEVSETEYVAHDALPPLIETHYQRIADALERRLAPVLR